MKFLTNNIVYKLSAVILSLLFWYFVQGEEFTEFTQPVRINLIIPNDYAVVGKIPRLKDVTFSGPRVFAAPLQGARLEAIIPLPAKELKSRIRVTRDMIQGLSDNVRAEIHDPYINLELDLKQTKKLLVKEVFKGLPANGFNIEKVAIEPEYIEAFGPKTSLAKITEVYTAPINITDINSNFSKSFELVSPSGVQLEIDEVKVSIQVGEKKINNKYNNIPIELVGGEYMANTKPKTVNIVIQGTPSTLQFIDTADLQATIQVRDMKPGSFTSKVQVKIPADTVLIETVPEMVKVEVYNRKK